MSGSSTPASWMFVPEESGPPLSGAGAATGTWADGGGVPEPPSSPPPETGIGWGGTRGRTRRGGGGGTWRRA